MANLFYFHKLLQNNPILTTQTKTSFENIVGKGENASN